MSENPLGPKLPTDAVKEKINAMTKALRMANPGVKIDPTEATVCALIGWLDETWAAFEQERDRSKAFYDDQAEGNAN